MELTNKPSTSETDWHDGVPSVTVLKDGFVDTSWSPSESQENMRNQNLDKSGTARAIQRTGGEHEAEMSGMWMVSLRCPYVKSTHPSII